MRSYDYCHFEITMGYNAEAMEVISASSFVDDMRKEAMRLVDKAVEQYKIAQQDEDYDYEDDYSSKDSDDEPLFNSSDPEPKEEGEQDDGSTTDHV